MKYKYIIILLLGFILISCHKNSERAVLVPDAEISFTPNSPQAGHEVTFVGKTNVASSQIKSWNWNFGVDDQSTASGDTVTFTYENAGTYEVHLKATDVNNNTLEYKKSITVQKAPSGKVLDFYVKEGATGKGTSWDNATSLAVALDSATSGSTIHIAAGTYLPSETITGGSPADDGDLTFEIDKNVALIGGFPANPEEGAESNPEKYKSILSGELNSGSSSYHVITIIAPENDTTKVTLNGLTITNGVGSSTISSLEINGIGKFYRDVGGGIIIGNSNVEIINTKIIGNKSGKYAAGIYIFGGSDVSIKNSKINNNQSASNAAAFWIRESKAYIYNSEINDNTTGGTAGAIYGYPEATVYIYNTTMQDNSGKSFGAAFYVREKSKGYLVNTLITGNTSTSTHGGGGVMMYDNCDVTIISSTITDNEIAGPGGGVFRQKGTNGLNIYNSIISGNKQKKGSSDVDAHSNDAVKPVIKSSAIGNKVFDDNGNEISGLSFDADKTLDKSYIPLAMGGDNPAIQHGMSIDALKTVANSFKPSLDQSLISKDMNGNSRSSLTIMGPLVE
jgi:PKD repeat protein